MKSFIFGLGVFFGISSLALANRSITDGLFSKEADVVNSGKSFAGTSVPVEVKRVLELARVQGKAVAFDVTELRSDGDGLWSPYPNPGVVFRSRGNMNFKYTEITPSVLQNDFSDKATESNWIVGEENGVITYVKKRGGTGKIAAQYDEAYHPDEFARGSYGQKWANNCAILSDGSLHCVPASRRNGEHPELILTIPALARGVHFLYHGHVDADAGVITGVEMSGRLVRRVTRDGVVLVNPIAILKAWGFKLSPNLQIVWGNTRDGVPRVDSVTQTLRTP